MCRAGQREKRAPAHSSRLHGHLLGTPSTVEHLGDRHPEPFGRDHLACQVLEHHRGAEGAGGLGHHDVGRRPLQAQRGEELVQMLPLPQRVRLRGDQGVVHGLGHGDELHLAGEGDEREAHRRADIHDRLRHGIAGCPELEDDSGDARSMQPRREGAQLSVVERPPCTRRQQQLSSVEQTRDADAVGDVHPPHRSIQRRTPDEHVRLARLHGGVGQHVGDREVHTVRRTVCPDNPDVATF